MPNRSPLHGSFILGRYRHGKGRFHTMNTRLIASVFLTAVSLAACGGGGGTGSAPPPTVPIVTPTSTPAPAPAGNIPLSEAVAGAAAWVEPTGHHSLYFLDVDTATGGTCVAGCLGVWPVDKPSTGSAASGNMTIITRSDGTGTQWAYQGHPLYMYAGDSGADQANGEGIPDFGGHWHVARPAATPTPAPGATDPPTCNGIYC